MLDFPRERSHTPLCSQVSKPSLHDALVTAWTAWTNSQQDSENQLPCSKLRANAATKPMMGKAMAPAISPSMSETDLLSDALGERVARHPSRHC